MFKCVHYDTLPEEAAFIREEVFLREQKFSTEFDEIDDIAKHMVVWQDDTAVACCRYFPDEAENAYIIGRIAVLQPYRKLHIGALIMKNVEETLKKQSVTHLSLSAQVRAQGFYEKQGYIAGGETYFDEYCEHIHMEKNI